MKKQRPSLNRHRRKTERDKFAGIKLIEDPFLWHVNQHFSGILSRFDQVDNLTLLKFLKTLALKIDELDQQCAFELAESNLRIIFVQRLRDHVLKKMAFQIAEFTNKDKDTPGFQSLNPDHLNYFDNLQQYFFYNNQIHFAHLLNCYSPGLENPSLEALMHSVDICYFNNIENPFWQNHLTYSVVDCIQCSLFQEDHFVWINQVLTNNLPQYNNLLSKFQNKTDPLTMQTIEKYSLQKLIDDTLTYDAHFTGVYIKKASQAIQQHEKKHPGFFVTLLGALLWEIRKYRASNFAKATIDSHIKKIDLFINSFGLRDAMQAYQKSEALKCRIRLDEQLKPIVTNLRDPSIEYPEKIDNYRLQLYGRRLIEREEDAVALQQDGSSRWFYRERFEFERGQDLANSQKLIEICGGSENLCWLAHQYGEYELDIWEDVFAEIDFNDLDLDEDILAYVMHCTFLHHFFLPDEMLQPGFISKTFDRFVGDLSQNINEQGDNPFKLQNLSELTNKIKNNFVSLLDKPQVSKLHTQFNEAYQQHDWLEMQRLWAVFSKFQRLLLSTQKEQTQYDKYPKYKAPKKGDDYSFGNNKQAMPKDYNELLDRAWSGYESHGVEKYIRIHPSHLTTNLGYRSYKNPSKSAKMDISHLLMELSQVGTNIGKVLAEFNPESGKSTNILTPIICFVVSDKPHQKNGDHKRIIIPVNLALLEHPMLLSKDFQDAVYAIVNEEEKNTYLKQQANNNYQHGMHVLHQQEIRNISNEQNSLLYHSEHVFLELLRRPEIAAKIIELLKHALSEYLDHSLEVGKYKVYAATILIYSKNSICDICTPSIITLQNSYQEGGFLYHLQNAINADISSFKLTTTQVPCLTIVTAAQPWSPQAHEFGDSIAETPNDSKTMSNPKSHLQFAKNCIELHSPSLDKQQKKPRQFNSIIEFVNPKFPSSAQEKPRFFKGNVFMSGSKHEKFQGRVDELNEKVDSIIMPKH